MADLAKLNVLAPLPTHDQPLAPNIQVFHVVESARMQSPPIAPSLYQMLELATPDFLSAACAPRGTRAMLGKLVGLSVNEGTATAHFAQHPGHPKAPLDGEQPFLSVPIHPAVSEAIINGGVLTHQDNICYGEMYEGVIFHFTAYVEVRDEQ